MKVMLTGASGRIGRELLANRPDGIEIEAFVEPLEQHIPTVPWARMDIVDRDAVMEVIGISTPDWIIHLAAMTNVDACERFPDKAFAVNRDGALNIAEAAESVGARVLYVSTDYVYDGKHGPYTEDDEPCPANEYGRSKLAGEKAVAGSAGAVILRISVPFGIRREGCGNNFISWLNDEFSGGSTVRIVDDQYTTPSYMPELADVVWRILDRGEHGVFHYGTADRLSRYEMALEYAELMEYSPDLIVPVKTADIGFDAPRPLESGFVTDRVHDLLGRPPVLFRNALYRMIEMH